MSVPLLVGPATFSFAASPRRDLATLQPGDALVRVQAGGICGSDLPFFRGAPVPSYAGGAAAPVGYPMHEIVGELVAVGPDTVAPAIGSIVVGWATRFDGMADFVVTDAGSLAPCPSGWDPAEAVLMQPLACVLYAVERLGDVAGRRCAVLGLGPIGLLFCHVLKDRGASVVTGVDRVDRRDVAAEFGIDRAYWTSSSQWAAALNANEQPDVVIEAVGHQVTTLQDAINAVAPTGRIFYFGVNDDQVYPLDMESMLRKNLTLMSGGTLD
ncbi:MAG TPA: zinc-binding dehydrogenase, partial [Jatrophihabitantaceae bacterium]|nr:zinc-binding dehydrogenase [Jatrophihabitantaceae bacterium]